MMAMGKRRPAPPYLGTYQFRPDGFGFSKYA